MRIVPCTNSISGYYLQMRGGPYQQSYQQPQRTNHWPNSQPAFGNMSHPSQSQYNPRMGTPVAPAHTYSDHVTYGTQQREDQYEGTPSNHMSMPMLNPQHAPTFNSQPDQHAGQEFYTPPRFSEPRHSHTHAGTQSNRLRSEDAQVQGTRGLHPPMPQGARGVRREMPAARDTRGGRGASCAEQEGRIGTPTVSIVGREAINPTSSPYTTPRSGTLFDQHDSTTEAMPVAPTNNSPMLFRIHSSKSSSPYMSSQRKQLRVEERSYLREVKNSIAEGRVPLVRLQQNSDGNIVQYKAQFLNALKLAALAVVPTSNIDVHNPSTMQDIMKEVKRQFIIEKPLPEGMVFGFLQRLYKRNRLVYHRHWTMHGDECKPDDCSPAAWSHLIDYWKSMEGHKECERNKSNASAKKKSPVSFLPLISWCPDFE